MKKLAVIGIFAALSLMVGCRGYEGNNPAIIFDDDNEVTAILRQRIERNGVEHYQGNNMTLVTLRDGSSCGVAYTASQEEISVKQVNCYGFSGNFI